MQLTDEQKHIIEYVSSMNRGDTLKIEAKAGSGKTSTLVEVAKANPDKMFLYLAFNKGIVTEAEGKFPSNVIVKTTHSLAYQHIVVPQKRKHKKIFVTGKFNLFALREFMRKHEIACAKYISKRATIDNVCSWDGVSILAGGYEDYLNSSMDEDEAPAIFRLMSKAVRAQELSYTHSFYLKEYQLLHEHPEIDEADFILLDEAQDTNPVTMGIINDCACSKILVGDSNQSIYSFRGAINALNTFQAKQTLYLTHCFRCPADVVERANFFLDRYNVSNDKYVPMVAAGFPRKADGAIAIISRTNTGLISAFRSLSQSPYIDKCNVSFVRKPGEIFAPVLNVLKFKDGADKSELDSQFRFLSYFHSLSDLKNYADKTNSFELVMAINLADKYGDSLFDLYQEIEERCKQQDPNKYPMIFTTAHSSKGLEFDNVVLLGDFASLSDLKTTLDLDMKNGKKNQVQKDLRCLFDETNCYYVAMTRAKQVLLDITDNDHEFDQKSSNQQYVVDKDTNEISPQVFKHLANKRV